MEILPVIVSVLSGSVGTGIIIFFFREMIKRQITESLQKELNTHKQELDAKTEQCKHILQRDMLKVEAFTKNKFQIYPELYDKIRISHGEILGLWGLRFSIDTSTFNESDISEYLDSRKVIDSEKQRIINEFRNNNEQGIKLFNKLIRGIELNEARNSHVNAKNFLLINELFISQKILEIAEDVLKHIWSIWTFINVSEMPGCNVLEQTEYTDARDKANNGMIILRDAIRAEITPI